MVEEHILGDSGYMFTPYRCFVFNFIFQVMEKKFLSTDGDGDLLSKEDAISKLFSRFFGDIEYFIEEMNKKIIPGFDLLQ